MISIDSKTLLNSIQFVESAVPKDDTRYYLNGLYLDFEGDVLRIVATNGHVIAVVTTTVSSDISGRPGVIIPFDSIPLLKQSIKGMPKDSEVSIVLRQTGVAVGGIEYVAIDAKYVDWRRAVPSEITHNAAAVGVNTDYLANAAKAFRAFKLKYQTARLHVQSPRSAIILERDHVSDHVARLEYIVMPVGL